MLDNDKLDASAYFRLEKLCPPGGGKVKHAKHIKPIQSNTETGDVRRQMNLLGPAEHL